MRKRSRKGVSSKQGTAFSFVSFFVEMKHDRFPCFFQSSFFFLRSLVFIYSLSISPSNPFSCFPPPLLWLHFEFKSPSSPFSLSLTLFILKYLSIYPSTEIILSDKLNLLFSWELCEFMFFPPDSSIVYGILDILACWICLGGKKSWKKDEENKNISKAILFPAFFASFQTAREGENYF